MSEKNFILLEECNIDIKKLLGMGIRGDIKLALMNERNSQFQFLSSGTIQKIYSCHPKKVYIVVGRATKVTSTKSPRIYEQHINASDLWVDSNQLNEVINRANNQIMQQEHVFQLEDSPYFKELSTLFNKAISGFPAWKEEQKQMKKPIQKSGNVHEWLKGLGASDREAELTKKILSDFYEDFQ